MREARQRAAQTVNKPLTMFSGGGPDAILEGARKRDKACDRNRFGPRRRLDSGCFEQGQRIAPQ